MSRGGATAAARFVRILATLLVLAGSGEAAWPGSGDSGDPLRAGLTLRDPSGAPRSLEDLRGRIVVLNFWATWCLPCREEMPLFGELHRRYAPRGVEVVAASADDEDDLDKVVAYIDEQGLAFPVWIGARISDMDQLGLGAALPATAILDREGRVAFRILGPVTREDLLARVEFLLGGGGGEAPVKVLDTFTRREVGSPNPGDARREGGPQPSDRQDGEDRPGSDPDDLHAGDEPGAEAEHGHGEGEPHRHGAPSGKDASLVPS